MQLTKAYEAETSFSQLIQICYVYTQDQFARYLSLSPPPPSSLFFPSLLPCVSFPFLVPLPPLHPVPTSLSYQPCSTFTNATFTRKAASMPQTMPNSLRLTIIPLLVCKQYNTLHYTTLHYTTLHYTTLHYTTLHYTTIHYNTVCILHSHTYNTAIHWQTSHADNTVYSTHMYSMLVCAIQYIQCNII